MEINKTIKNAFAFIVFAFSLQCFIIAQTWPTASEQAGEMAIGWNIGNSLEVPGNETGWGNPLVTQELIDAVKAEGFNTLRIPCAWDSYADQSTNEISATWLARVAEVVNYGFNNDMFVILNSHWDRGWLENHPTYDYQEAVNIKQEAYWTQIANYFKDYGPKLLFAGTNEVHADYGTPTSEHIEVQESYNQTFVDAVRATGGNNAYRNLIVQFYNTNYWHGINYFTAPNDAVSGHLFLEAHHYDPYDFTLNEDNSSACIVWGSPWSGGDVCSWGQESYTDNLFGQIKTKFVDQGYPVIMGEYGVIKRTGLSGQDLTDHLASRLYYLEYVTAAAKENGIIPVYWDNGWKGENGFALFDRNNGNIVDQDAIDALMEGAGEGDPNTTYTLTTNVSGSGSVDLDPNGGSYTNGTTVTLTANAASGYEFAGWNGDLNGNINPATLIMNSDKSVTATFVVEGSGGSGTILREYWTGISGNKVSSLTSSSDYPDNPTGSEQLTSLEGPTNWDKNYGTRIRGYIHPPVTGSYTLFVAGDDNTQLLLSSDESVANANVIAHVDGWTNPREWDKYPSQSASVNLIAGQKYYIEVLHKEGNGGDNVAVAWQGPGISQAVIEGAYLSPFIGGNNGTTQYSLTTNVSGSGSVSPSNGTYDEGTVISLTANPSSGYEFSGWSGDLNGSTNPASLTMDSDKSVTAIFTETQTTQYSLTTSTSGSGSISLSPSGGTYDSGTVVTLTATASSGHVFSGWSGSLNGSTNPATLTMNADMSVTATFTEQPNGEPCDNPSNISISFTQEGPGEFCFVTSDDISSVNSWAMDVLEINGQDYANKWSNSLPGRVNGNYYIYYKGSYGWSHFEASGVKGNAIADNSKTKVHLYPNPFNGTINMVLNDPDQINQIVIMDQLGRTVKLIDKSSITFASRFGEALESGLYIVQVYGNQGVQNFTINKK